MTKEDKELLLKDLCARLPYGVILVDDNGDNMPLDYKGTIINKRFIEVLSDSIDDYGIKPYLRPMSSMTEEEKEKWTSTFDSVYDLVPGGNPDNEDDYDDNWHHEPSIESFDWLNAHHFDYRCLIEKGLAIEAPEGMYKEK